jgi:hypothetical protein
LSVAPDTAPTIIGPADPSISTNSATAALALTIGDDFTAAAALTLTKASSNPTLVPTSGIVFGGSSANRTVTVTPAANQLGTATITVMVSDGVLTTSDTFLVTVSGTPLETWRFANFGTTANTGLFADTADKDNDGLPNFLEYATASNPNTSNPSPHSAARSGSNLEYLYTKNKAATDITYIVEWSDTLTAASWSSAGLTSSVLSDNGTTQQLKVTVPAGSGVVRRFVRLKVTRP